MPFTFAHPSAILPLKNKSFNLSGLILGSMAPDFIYFILFNPSSNIGHTFLGFVLFNLPICFLLNYIFYKYIQELFIVSMPTFISTRYIYLVQNKNQLSNRKDILRFIYSCLIGMLTHIFWDAFTHKTGFFVNQIPFLKHSILIFDVSIPIFKILQHGSSFIGFIFIFIYIFNRRDKNINKYTLKINKTSIYLSILLIFILILIMFITIFIKVDIFIGVGRLVITSINSLLISYLIVGFIFKKKLEQ
jgi:hypothetical protein